MGLCKCPKKKVTNLFCFEHRVNVCEHCLVSNHPKCIVQSYLQWLQDSDYDPECQICQKNLSDEEKGECVRLVCYDVFHWSCIDNYARCLPANTAPAGYSCPICKSGIFPANNIVSPVAEALRKTLAKVNWARAGLGLPLIEEPHPPSEQLEKSFSVPQVGHSVSGDFMNSPHTHSYSPNQQSTPSPSPAFGQTHSVVTVDDATPYTRGAHETDFDPRKLFDSTHPNDLMNMTHDHDEDKYKRRPAMQWFSRWFKSRGGTKRQDPNAGMKRGAVILIIVVLVFLTFVVVFTRVGRASAERDPFLDPMANPNIRVEDS